MIKHTALDWRKMLSHYQVVLVDIKSRKKRQTNMAGTKPVTSKHIRKVNEQRGPASGNIDNNTNTVGLEKVVPSVPPREIKAPTIFIEPMNGVAVNPISGVPRNERVLGTNVS